MDSDFQKEKVSSSVSTNGPRLHSWPLDPKSSVLSLQGRGPPVDSRGTSEVRFLDLFPDAHLCSPGDLRSIVSPNILTRCSPVTKFSGRCPTLSQTAPTGTFSPWAGLPRHHALLLLPSSHWGLLSRLQDGILRAVTGPRLTQHTLPGAPRPRPPA